MGAEFQLNHEQAGLTNKQTVGKDFKETKIPGGGTVLRFWYGSKR